MTALLASIIVGGVALVILSVAQTNLRATASTRDHDDALHTAEAGADRVVASMVEDRTFDTGHTPPGAGDDERSWAAGLALDAFETFEETGELPGNAVWHEGHFGFGIRPEHPSVDGPEGRVYGVSVLDGTTRHVRVVVYNLTADPFRPTHAVLTEGPLEISGNVDIAGDAGAVHTNGSLSFSGTPTISQTATASSGCAPGNAVIGAGGSGECEPAEPTIRIPRITAREHYLDHTNYPKDVWFDLCPGGVMRYPSPQGPCDAAAEEVPPSKWQGWVHKHDTWGKSGNGASTGIFYVYQQNVDVKGKQNLDDVTLYVEKDPSGAGGASGNVSIGGSTEWTPYDPAVAVIADRDIVSLGNAESGAVIAGEQVEWGGNLGSEGSGEWGIILAQDRGDPEGTPSTVGSPISSNRIHGNIYIVYDGDVVLDVDAGLRVGAWNEL
ncbi:MAG: hypothetical protein WEB09_00120 [Nitriliruptor sp.]